jgi:transcriptional regulator with XRE-family HTH domain
MSTGHTQDGEVMEPAKMADRSDDATTWRPWMLELGHQIRRLRELVGLSQQELARLAKVSQGAVSRLESARGLATPLLIVVKINLALTTELRKLEGPVSNADLCPTRGVQDLLRGPAGALGLDTVHSTPDPTFEALVRLFHETRPRHRDRLLAILRNAVAALEEPGRADE